MNPRVPGQGVVAPVCTQRDGALWDGPKRSNHRGGQGVEQWVRAATEATRQRFILPGLVRTFPTP